MATFAYVILCCLSQPLSSASDVEQLILSKERIEVLVGRLADIPDEAVITGLTNALAREHKSSVHRRVIHVIRKEGVALRKRTIETLATHLDEARPRVATEVLRLGAERGVTNSQFAEAAIRLFGESDNGRLRIAVVSYLTNAPSDDGDELLTRVARDRHAGRNVRYRAVQSLGRMEDKADIVVPVLIEILDDTQERPYGFSAACFCSVPIGYDAARSLASLGKAATPAAAQLRRILGSDDCNSFLRPAIAQAVIAITGPHHEALRALQDDLSSNDWFVQTLAMRSIQHVGANGLGGARQGVIEALAEILKSPKNEPVERVVAAEVLVDIGGDQGTRLVERASRADAAPWLRDVFQDILKSAGSNDEEQRAAHRTGCE